MTLKSFFLGIVYVSAICFWVVIIALIVEEVAVRWRMKKDLEKARKVE